MRSQFFERRRQLREPVTDGQALIAGQPFGLLNWSQNGLLLAAAGPLPERGSRLSAEIDLMAVRREREQLKAELARLEAQMDAYLKELGYE